MSIDDLFSGGAIESPRPPAAKKKTRLISLLVIAAAITGLVTIGLRLANQTASIPGVYATAVVLVIVWRIVRGLKAPPPSRQAGRSYEERVVIPDGLEQAINRWDTMLDWCHTDAARYNRRVLPRLGELADERLRLRHGITRTSDPERARQLLGDPLWTQITMPVRRPPQPREVTQIVTALERL